MWQCRSHGCWGSDGRAGSGPGSSFPAPHWYRSEERAWTGRLGGIGTLRAGWGSAGSTARSLLEAADPYGGKILSPLKVLWCRGSSLSKAREICISVAFFCYGAGQPGAIPVQWMNPPKASGEASPAIRTRPGEAALPEQCHLLR